MPDGKDGRGRVLAPALVALAAVVLWVPMPSAWVERGFSMSIYPWWQRLLTPLSDRVPFAWFDVWLLLAAAGLVWRAGRAWRGAATRFRGAGRVVLAVLQVTSAVYLWFMASWGLNYRREAVETRVDFDERRITAEAADALAARTVAALNRLHPLAHAAPWPEWADVPRQLAPRLAPTARALGLPAGIHGGRPHPTILQPYFRWASIEGMTDPFLLDVLVNDDLLPFERPAMVAHEWGHLAGLAAESEASYFGWRLCLEGDAQMQYSAWLFISGHSLGSVPPERRGALIATLAGGPRLDLRAIAARQQRSVPVVRDAAWAAYDRYLKSNRVSEGVQSYDHVLRLILGTAQSGAETTRQN